MRFAWIEEPPFNFAAAEGVTGSDVELIGEVCRRLGEPVELVETSFAELLPGLEAGRWEVATGMFVTPERAARAAFTRPIWRLADGLLVRRGARVRGYRDLAAAGMRLGVLRDQVQHRTALDAGVADILVLETHAEATEAVRRGQVAAYASVALAHGRAVREDPGLAVVSVPEAERPASPGAFACATGALRDRIDGELARLIATEWHGRLLTRFGLGREAMPAA